MRITINAGILKKVSEITIDEDEKGISIDLKNGGTHHLSGKDMMVTDVLEPKLEPLSLDEKNLKSIKEADAKA